MIFKSSYDRIGEWVDKKPEPHLWFAWFPVNVGSPTYPEYAFLQRVYRQRDREGAGGVWFKSYYYSKSPDMSQH